MKVGDVVCVGGGRGEVTELLSENELVVRWKIRTFTGCLTHHSAVYHVSELEKVNHDERSEQR